MARVATAHPPRSSARSCSPPLPLPKLEPRPPTAGKHRERTTTPSPVPVRLKRETASSTPFHGSSEAHHDCGMSGTRGLTQHTAGEFRKRLLAFTAKIGSRINLQEVVTMHMCGLRKIQTKSQVVQLNFHVHFTAIVHVS